MKYCLLGEKLGHSYSKEIHSFSGINYSLKEVEKNEIENFLKQDFDGFNVTIPYKKEIISYLDQLDQSASEIGSVNTVVRENGMLIGHNTDVFGMEYALNLAKKLKNLLHKVKSYVKIIVDKSRQKFSGGFYA